MATSYRTEQEIQEYLRRHEHDACALMAAVRKDGQPSHGVILASVEALVKMVHRSGDVDGEGDGCGIQIDLPRPLWAGLLEEAGKEPALAEAQNFAVAHFFVPRSEAYWAKTLKEQICRRIEADGFTVVHQRSRQVRTDVLGPRGRHDEPEFWQVAVLAPGKTRAEVNQACFRLGVAIEEESELHVVSFSADTVVYKVRGDARILLAYYPDLGDPRCTSRTAIGHNRYSTNTSTAFERVQPFTALGHNGEINTIRQLREQATQLGLTITRGGSDSQDLNRTMEGMIHEFGVTLFEAIEMLFPPIIGEIKGMPPALQDLYMYYRQAWGPYAQGPAAIAARSGDYMVASVDAMGLRPFWMVETDELVYFSSEQGIVPTMEMVRDPHPIAPGEKVGVYLGGGRPEILTYTEMQNRVLRLSRTRFPEPELYRKFIELGGPEGRTLEVRFQGRPLSPYQPGTPAGTAGTTAAIPQERLMSAMGWSGEDLQLARTMAGSGAEPIGSLGFDGPLACLSDARQNLADYFKESVAVVTNPAVDREREIEHFSTRTVLGARPPVAVRRKEERRAAFATRVELRLPVLMGGHRAESPISYPEYRDVARAAGTFLLEDLVAEFDPLHGAGKDPGVVRHIYTAFAPTETLSGALTRLSAQAIQAVGEGAQLLIIDDATAFDENNLFIDPHLVLSAVDRALRLAEATDGLGNLRRRCSLVLRSGALRSLHDVVLALGLGADAVNPYLLLEVASGEESPKKGLENLIGSLNKGLEKVISTLGIHEFRGYARCFSHIGLKPEVAVYFGCEGYMGSQNGGVSLARLKADAGERYRIAHGEGKGDLARTFHFWPRLWKAVGEAAENPPGYESYLNKLHAQERETPVSLRHLLDFKRSAGEVIGPVEVDTTVEDYRYPITISGMSFGSQGEIAFRSYAEAAKRLDIVAMNGEGGEIPDMVGRYWKWRGQQVASGRFGVHAEMLSGSRFIEIKVGQGAKPGEGGHLPGSKVSAKVARARNAAEGVDLISPSNNHDVYSIEDLAQLVEELKTINPMAKIVVKVPVVPGIGTIAVGVAKSGADVVALCGYDGGTGAARKHALRHAGLPIEIGVREAHLALVAAGVRDRVEVWGDSGVKSGTDVVKLMLLGANRVGFATMAMVAIGCTICRGCQLDTCHVGIATQMESMEEARHKGLKSFVPRVYDEAVERLVTLFTCVGEEVRRLTGQLGFARTQDLVGRAELLKQVRGIGQVDLAELTAPVAWESPAAVAADRAPIRQCAPNHLTREIAAVATGKIEAGDATVNYSQSGVTARDRILGTYLAGEVARTRVGSAWSDEGPVFKGLGAGRQLPKDFEAVIELKDGSVAGNGLAAWNTQGVKLVVHGGAQDGVGKGMLGGEVIVLKSMSRYGGWVGGSVGKSFGYGAQRGTFIVQGDADARCGIRLSGADLIIGGGLKGPVDDGIGSVGTRANLKGFAFEYMTQGRAVVLGDPGPWICSGMTGGVVYVRLQPSQGLDEGAIKRRLAKGAKVYLTRIGNRGKKDLNELLSKYHKVLLENGQGEAAAEMLDLLFDLEHQFVAIIPVNQQMDASIATE